MRAIQFRHSGNAVVVLQVVQLVSTARDGTQLLLVARNTGMEYVSMPLLDYIASDSNGYWTVSKLDA